MKPGLALIMRFGLLAAPPRAATRIGRARPNPQSTTITVRPVRSTLDRRRPAKLFALVQAFDGLAEKMFERCEGVSLNLISSSRILAPAR